MGNIPKITNDTNGEYLQLRKYAYKVAFQALN